MPQPNVANSSVNVRISITYLYIRGSPWNFIAAFSSPKKLESWGYQAVKEFQCCNQPFWRDTESLTGSIYSVSQKIPPAVFSNGWEFLINFLHTYYTFLSTLDYKFLFNYLQLWRGYAILSESTHRIFLTFHLNLTSKFAYWANGVTVEVMSYPACLLTL